MISKKKKKKIMHIEKALWPNNKMSLEYQKNGFTQESISSDTY